MTHAKQSEVAPRVFIKYRSGSVIHPNLDDISIASLLEAQAMHKQKGKQFSQSVLIRRAVRLYSSYLKQLTKWDSEVMETRRAEKGVC